MRFLKNNKASVLESVAEEIIKLVIFCLWGVHIICLTCMYVKNASVSHNWNKAITVPL